MKYNFFMISLGLVVASFGAWGQSAADENSARVAGYLTDQHKNDKSEKKTVFKFQFALAYEQIPAITNTVSADGSYSSYSTYDVLSFPAATTGIEFRWNPAKFISLRLKPSATYGVSVGSGAYDLRYFCLFGDEARRRLVH
jgi:hypothetical protein